MNSKVMIVCTVLAVAVLLQSTPADATWGSCASIWKTVDGVGIVSTVYKCCVKHDCVHILSTDSMS